MARLSALAAAVAVLAAGCGGGEDAPAQVGLRTAAGSPAPGAARVLERFVAAAGRGDSVEMWGLLSRPTRQSFGGTLPGFRENAAGELVEDVGPLARSGRLVLARAFGPQWAVAGVAGEVERDGEPEPAAYAAALRREGSAWRVELGGVFFAWHRPSPLAEVRGRRPLLGVTAQSSAEIERMVVWLDGEPLGARTLRPQPFTGAIAARPSAPLAAGVHVVAVFAATAETAGAYAWPFEVRD